MGCGTRVGTAYFSDFLFIDNEQAAKACVHMAAIQRRQRESPQSKDATYSNRIPDFFFCHTDFSNLLEMCMHIYLYIYTQMHMYIYQCVYMVVLGNAIGLQTF